VTPGPESILATETDVLILGGGIAGHRAAVPARQQGMNVSLVFLAKGHHHTSSATTRRSGMQTRAMVRRSTRP